jgi:hypothetical protein
MPLCFSVTLTTSAVQYLPTELCTVDLIKNMKKSWIKSLTHYLFNVNRVRYKVKQIVHCYIVYLFIFLSILFYFLNKFYVLEKNIGAV